MARPVDDARHDSPAQKPRSIADGASGPREAWKPTKAPRRSRDADRRVPTRAVRPGALCTLSRDGTITARIPALRPYNGPSTACGPASQRHWPGARSAGNASTP